MKYIKILILILLAEILLSCTKQVRDFKKDAIKIEIQDNNSYEYDYSALIDSLKVIRLETNENSLIGGIRKIVYKHKKFFIQDKNHNLLIFHEDGRFFNKISKRGKGPGEYIELRDFYIKEDGNILILTWKKILTYNLNSDFLEEFIMNINTNTGRELNPTRFTLSGEYFYFFMGSFGLNSIDNGKEMALFCVNRYKKILKQYFPLEYNITHLHNMLYNSDSSINYTNGYGNDTIYHIENTSIYPGYIIDFKNKKIDKYDMMESDRVKLFNNIWNEELKGNVSNVFESNEYLCFKFSQGRSFKQVVYNKKTQNPKVINVRKSLPFPAIVVSGVNNNSFFSVVEPYMILQMNNDHIYDSLISNIKIKETDNPLVFKYKFKTS